MDAHTFCTPPMLKDMWPSKQPADDESFSLKGDRGHSKALHTTLHSTEAIAEYRAEDRRISASIASRVGRGGCATVYKHVV